MLIVSWCGRCSGFRYSRLGAALGSGLDSSSLELYESHFLPAEETDPSEMLHLTMRAFRCAQEWQQDYEDMTGPPAE